MGRAAARAAAFVLVIVVAACGPQAPTASPSPASVIPADPCSVVDAADVQAAFGGTSTPGRISGDGACSFDVTGPVHAAPTGSSSGRVDISFADAHTPSADQKGVLGDSVEVVDGLGADAWWMPRTLHVEVPGGELVVKGTWFGSLDDAILLDDTKTLANAILGRL